jgi:hypothetical protein
MEVAGGDTETEIMVTPRIALGLGVGATASDDVVNDGVSSETAATRESNDEEVTASEGVGDTVD